MRFAAILAACACSAHPALAEGAEAGDTVTEGRHRIAGEVGYFSLFGWGAGPAFGLGYAYRAGPGLELGAGLRYMLVPAHTGSTPEARRVGSSGPIVYPVDPALHAWLPFASVRGSLPLDASGRFEPGVTARAEVLVLSDASDMPCAEVALAPDVRVWLGHGTALQIAPEIAIGTTVKYIPPGPDGGGGRPLILQAAVWLTLVQTL
jgi:hypothetical protein